jgi:hypothetical protein
MFQKVKLLNRQSDILMTVGLELSRTWCTVQVVIWTVSPHHKLATCPLKREEALSSTLPVRIYQTADRCIPEGSILDTYHCESPRSHKWVITCILCPWRTAGGDVSVLWRTEGSDFILWKIPCCDFLYLRIVVCHIPRDNNFDRNITTFKYLLSFWKLLCPWFWDWMELAQDGDRRRALVCTVRNFKVQ